MSMQCEQRFFEIYGRDPEGLSFSPYRVCPIGAHSDHNLGKITGFAINKGIHIAYRPKKNGVVEMTSLQFPKRAQWHIASVPKTKENDWADYLRGATWALSKTRSLTTGICGVIEGVAAYRRSFLLRCGHFGVFIRSGQRQWHPPGAPGINRYGLRCRKELCGRQRRKVRPELRGVGQKGSLAVPRYG